MTTVEAKTLRESHPFLRADRLGGDYPSYYTENNPIQWLSTMIIILVTFTFIDFYRLSAEIEILYHGPLTILFQHCPAKLWLNKTLFGQLLRKNLPLLIL